IDARVPNQLADAVEARADASGLSTADVVRHALVREVSEPADRMSRAYVEQWLANAQEK
ncbi:MAG: hypothetical protein JWN04_1710, partial [Myxococcaceae bacterium]|nr:hypothetical protein [Myxococcaceae bacterium]